MSRMTNALSFIAGAVVGGGAVWYCIREKEAARANREIDSVKAAYAKREHVEQHDEAPAPIPSGKIQDKPDLADYVRKLEREGYTEYSRTVKPTEKADSETSEDTPYVISPAEFGEIDVDEIVGDALEHFGEYEEDSAFVRNDAKRCDYEILQDLRNFKDVLEDMSPRPN